MHDVPGSRPVSKHRLHSAGAAQEGAGTGWVVALADASEMPGELIGGKASRLARLMRDGFPVPQGFCVTTSAFEQFLGGVPGGTEPGTARATDLSRQASTLSSRTGSGADRLATRPMPPAIVEAVLLAWRRQGEERVYAVRSSATLEDAAEHSFAGQFESFLNVRGEAALLEAIRGCWRSLSSERVLAYQTRHHLSAAKASMAVLVQEMVPADWAGVVFTADPVTGNTRRILIEGAPGLGDRLVSGQVKPERVVLAKDTLNVLEREPQEGAGLSDELARRLGRLALEVERLAKGPQDLEWAVVGGKIALLQARAITGRAPPRSWEDRQVWSNVNGGEVMPDVTTPMTWSMVQLFLADLARPLFRVFGLEMDRAPTMGRVAGRVYFNVNTGLAAMRPFARLFERIPNVGRAMGGGHLVLHESGALNIPAEDIPDLGFRWSRYMGSWPRVLLELIRHSPRCGDAWTARLKARGDPLAGLDLEQIPTVELARHFDRLRREGFEDWDLLYLVMQASALPWFQWACHRWLDDPDLTQGYRLFAALGEVPEAEAGLALWRLATQAHAHPGTEAAILETVAWPAIRARLTATEPGRRFLESWDAFVAEHGHHGRGELELFNARWSERPDYLLGLVRGYLRAIDQVDPLENQRRLARERELLTSQCLERLRNPLKRWIFSRSLRRAQKLAINREEWKNQAVRHLAALRRLLLVLGQRLLDSGVLDRADDIFFLEVTEIEPAASGRPAVDVKTLLRQRRAEYERNLTLKPPPVVFGRFDPDLAVEPAVPVENEMLKGIAVYPGVVTGLARVILRADDHEQVLPGEILIAPFTDPAWTPYFLPAAAVVMDLGGILSHGSIVAREYGLPAVTNVGSATKVIRTGDLVQVDGNRGRVLILERAQSDRGGVGS